jgi:hypothetical protein
MHSVQVLVVPWVSQDRYQLTLVVAGVGFSDPLVTAVNHFLAESDPDRDYTFTVRNLEAYGRAVWSLHGVTPPQGPNTYATPVATFKL